MKTATTAINHIRTRAGLVSAVCELCGKISRPAEPDSNGEPDLWNMARGWSCAPYPANFAHKDGSIGSTYTCPACNKLAKTGAWMTVRAYLGGTGKTRQVVA